MFAIDLGAIAAGDPNVPVVTRDPEAFFRATYLTADLQKLLDEVLASLPIHQSWRRADPWFTPAVDALQVTRTQADWRAVQRGTVQHEILEGENAAAFIEDR